jgi:hypothetical protein
LNGLLVAFEGAGEDGIEGLFAGVGLEVVLDGDHFAPGPPVNALRRAVGFAAQRRHLLLEHQEQALAHDAALGKSR